MSGTPAAPAAPPSGSSKSKGGGAPSVSAARIKAAAATAFTMPSGIQLEVLSGQNWNSWSTMFSALLQLNDIDSVLEHDTLPSGVDSDDWESLQKKTKAYLRLYCASDVYSAAESDTEFPSFKQKFDRLREVHGNVGSTAIFNIWIALTQARLDDSSPLAPQLAKLNEARVQLSNSGMGVSDTQYCLILLNALPSSYEVVASTILASGPVSSLKYSEISARILNEEGRKAGPSNSLNAARKHDHSHLTCHYCKKVGHIQRFCRKKKKDEEEEEEEESEDSNSDADSKNGSTDSENSKKSAA